MVLNRVPSFQEVKDWVNNNADVPNADHADDADTVNGSTIYVQSSEPSNPSNDDIWVEK